jgi:hypothetical protein
VSCGKKQQRLRSKGIIEIRVNGGVVVRYRNGCAIRRCMVLIVSCMVESETDPQVSIIVRCVGEPLKAQANEQPLQ